jgi:uncharacterized protein (TIGR03435 family)
MAFVMHTWFGKRLNADINQVIFVGVWLGITIPAVFAQASAGDSKAEDNLLPGATYTVATIKPTSPEEMGSVQTLPSGEFISKGMVLKTLVGTAYKKFSFQILKGPGWFESDRYDLDAKPDSAIADQLQKMSWQQQEKVQRRMLQGLLIDRAKLKTHEETRELPFFALVVDKNGAKLREAKPGEPYRMMVGDGKIVAQGIPMDDLAEQLTANMDHIVSNKTGLAGTYDFTLRYSEDEGTKPDPSLPSLYTALTEQLGLKLESTKGPVLVLVIDHVERPTKN